MINAKDFLEQVSIDEFPMIAAYKDTLARYMEEYAREFLKDVPIQILGGLENLKVTNAHGVIKIEPNA